MRFRQFAALAGILSSAAVWAAPVCEIENIFPYVPEHCHGSSLVECPNGDLLACWFQGSGERTADDVRVNGARLVKGSKEWSPVFLMADTPGFPDCNPALYIDRQQRLWMFWIAVQAHRWECSLLKYRRAEEYQSEGPPKWSWQDVIMLKPGDKFADTLETRFEELGMGEGMWGEYALPYTRQLLEAAQDPYKRQTGWMTRLHPATLPSGRILLPLYSDGFNVSLIAISDDDGETWRASGPIAGAGPTQPAIVRKKDGALAAYLRDTGDGPQRVQLSISTDDGETWTGSKDIDIPNPDSSLEVVTLRDGRWVMIGNDTENGRHRLSALMSGDEGATWKWKRAVEPSSGGDASFAYPSVIQARDGTIQMTYSYASKEEKTIRHCTINSEWIEAVR